MRKIFLLLLIFNSAYAKDFGVTGNTFPIKERNFTEVIQERINSMSTEDSELLNGKIQKHYTKLLHEPKPVQGIQNATSYEVHYFDPTITVNHDIKDHEDSVIVKKGTKYNPLSIYRLERDLIFFDGNDENQVEWAKKQNGAWILVNGKPLKLEEEEEKPVFFDQGGVLVKKFGIKKVPSRVSQEKNLLKIEALPVGGNT